ncbi:hypothetical protein ABID14_001147 [Peptoniphilus olsenii]|uniref:Uncharacterized protein n=1 Tax=Peptoniphilus olsenii TaxID=411570 RepID=A0ABV2JB89_9FIRM
MKKVIFDTNPLGSFQLSCAVYELYYKKKFNKEIFFYTRQDGKYIRINSKEKRKNLANRCITQVDLGKSVDEIPFDSTIRVAPFSEEYEDDKLLIDIVEKLGEDANWKESKIKVVELTECE